MDPTGLFSNAWDKYIAHVGNIDEPATWNLTEHIGDAMQFHDEDLAMEFYCTQSRSNPTTTDGKPNSPLYTTLLIALIEV